MIDNPEFYISNKGKCMLTYNGYRYTKQRKSAKEEKAQRFCWRCVHTNNGRYFCKSYATTYFVGDQQKASFRGVHLHPPWYK